ncbi:MAG: hypothetical protein AB8G14_19185 [Ilumatobacter sp.]
MFTRRVFGVLAALVVACGAFFVGATSAPTSTLALPGAAEATVVTVTPTRVLDTRVGVGLEGSFAATGSRKLQVTGTIATYVEATATRQQATVVPEGATGVLLNVTAVRASASGFISVRPGDATGDPSTSSLNFAAGQALPNAVTVQLPTSGIGAGQIDLSFRSSTQNATVEIVVDVVGYTLASGLTDLTDRLVALEALGPGDAGPKGEQGDPGERGEVGPPGLPGVDPARVVWVAESGGDFTSLSAALAATTGPAVIRIAPGTYVETEPVTMKDGVDIEGSGRNVTTLRCACSTTSGPDVETAAGAVLYKPSGVDSAVSHLSVENNNSDGDLSYGIKLFGTKHLHDVSVDVRSYGAYGILAVGTADPGSAIENVRVRATGGGVDMTPAYGIYNRNSDTPIVNSSIFVQKTSLLTGYGVYNDGSEVSMIGLDIEVRGTSNVTAYGVYNNGSEVLMIGLDIEVRGNGVDSGYGVYTIDGDTRLEDSRVRASANTVTVRVAAVLTTRTAFGTPSTTIVDSVLGGGQYGVYNTGNSAYAIIIGSELSGFIASVRGVAYLESSTVRQSLDPSIQECFNVRRDFGGSTPSYTTLDAACN